MITQPAFLEKYNVDKKQFETSALQWSELEAIASDYDRCRSEMELAGNSIVQYLSQADGVHSLKFRMKEKEHLLAKIIRKTFENPSFRISVKDYREKITDLIGVRALHLFKEDWVKIHSLITENWVMIEKPTANIRRGDPERVTKTFSEKGCEVKEHPFGYRSVHYLVTSQPTKNKHIAEIQVRTIFEEGWSEIDHIIRYPNNRENEIVNDYLSQLNRLAGYADEMGTCIPKLKRYLESIETEKSEYKQEISKSLKKLELSETHRKELEGQIEKLSKVGTEYVGLKYDSVNIDAYFANLGALEDISNVFKSIGNVAKVDKCSVCGKALAKNAFNIFSDAKCDECRKKDHLQWKH